MIKSFFFGSLIQMRPQVRHVAPINTHLQWLYAVSRMPLSHGGVRVSGDTALHNYIGNVSVQRRPAHKNACGESVKLALPLHGLSLIL